MRPEKRRRCTIRSSNRYAAQHVELRWWTAAMEMREAHLGYADPSLTLDALMEKVECALGVRGTEADRLEWRNVAARTDLARPCEYEQPRL